MNTRKKPIIKHDFNYITPQQYKARYRFDDSLSELTRIAKLADNPRLCPSCKQFAVWEYGGCGMCFSCTTGETDASDDYELTLDERKCKHGNTSR